MYVVRIMEFMDHAILGGAPQIRQFASEIFKKSFFFNSSPVIWSPVDISTCILINTVVTLYNICSSFGLHTWEAAEDGKDEGGGLLL